MTDHRDRLSAAVLISGGGSNLQAIIDAANNNDINAEVSVVISNKPDAYGLTRARNSAIDAVTVRHADYPTREEFDVAMIEVIDNYKPDVVVLAGFMRILTNSFVEHYAGRIVNIHPSLLPKYPGLNTHQRALDAGDKWHGCTVHFVTEQLDGGPPIIQGRVPVLDGDDAEQLASRVLGVEHPIYVKAIKLIADGRLKLSDPDVWLDGKKLSAPIQFKP